MRAVLALCTGSLIAAHAGTSRAGDEPSVWSPGERTTSAVGNEVRADDAVVRGDGVYGRFGGRFDFAANAGAEIREGGVTPAVHASLHHFSMAGIYAEYSDALGGDRPTSRQASFGVDFRPAFVPRWSKDYETGPGFSDLAIDSISLGLGAFFREPRGRSFGDAKGLELSLGFGVPLAGRAAGPWVRTRGALRWDEPSARARPALLLTVGWDFLM